MIQFNSAQFRLRKRKERKKRKEKKRKPFLHKSRSGSRKQEQITHVLWKNESRLHPVRGPPLPQLYYITAR